MKTVESGIWPELINYTPNPPDLFFRDPATGKCVGKFTGKLLPVNLPAKYLQLLVFVNTCTL